MEISPPRRLTGAHLFAIALAWLTLDNTVVRPVGAFVPSLGRPLSTSHRQEATSFRRPQTAAYVSVVSQFIEDSLGRENNDAVNAYMNNEQKLTRPERKALERKKKASNSKSAQASRKSKKLREYKLHSQAISKLTKESTPDEVIKAIKRAQNLHDAHDLAAIETFLLKETDESYAYGYRGSLLSRLAVAALHMNNHEVARKAIEVRRREHRSSMLPMESAAIIRGLLRVHNVTNALMILDDELSLPLEGTPLDTPETQSRIKHRALSMASVASRHFFEGEPSMSAVACRNLEKMGPIVHKAGLTIKELQMPWARILQGAAQCDAGRRAGTTVPCMPDVELPCNLVYLVLNAMTAFPSDNNDKTYEALSNALVRRTVFVTGAVDMEGCPPMDRGEAIFIGRSNVGKSSLVNMVTNRKSLAYTSKRPGKTQQFNYFAVNDKPGRDKELKYGDVLPGEKDPDSFYMVDFPGSGFAKAPQQQRQKWMEFRQTFLANRKTLRVVFHLVDSRHGPIDEDERIMKEVGEFLPKNVQYVVVLTKADKNVKGSAAKNTGGKVSHSVMDNLEQIMKQNKVGHAPIVLTSSETKLGRDDIWRYLRLAAEG